MSSDEEEENWHWPASRGRSLSSVDECSIDEEESESEAEQEDGASDAAENVEMDAGVRMHTGSIQGGGRESGQTSSPNAQVLDPYANPAVGVRAVAIERSAS